MGCDAPTYTAVGKYNKSGQKYSFLHFRNWEFENVAFLSDCRFSIGCEHGLSYWLL